MSQLTNRVINFAKKYISSNPLSEKEEIVFPEVEKSEKDAVFNDTYTESTPHVAKENFRKNQNSVRHLSLDKRIARAEIIGAKIDPSQYAKVLKREEILSFQEISQIQNYIILDFETTGLNAQTDRITEFCIQVYVNNQMIEEFCEMVNPGKSVPDVVTKKTGITNEMLKDKKDISVYLDKIAAMVHNSVIIGHNIKFDLDFLASELVRNKYNGKPLQVQFIDTLRISQKKLLKAPDHKLETLKNFLGIEVVSHRAQADCLTTNALFLHLIRK